MKGPCNYRRTQHDSDGLVVLGFRAWCSAGNQSEFRGNVNRMITKPPLSQDPLPGTLRVCRVCNPKVLQGLERLQGLPAFCFMIESLQGPTEKQRRDQPPGVECGLGFRLLLDVPRGEHAL